MTARERRLRERIDQLTDERDDALLVLATVARRRATLRPRCVYCGGERARGVNACEEHRDLLAVDPFYAETVAA